MKSAGILDALQPHIPTRFDRAKRVELIGMAACALRDGGVPDREAATFLSAALLAWLQEGGDLTAEYFQTRAPRGSHVTEAHIWAALIRMNDRTEKQAQDRDNSTSTDP